MRLALAFISSVHFLDLCALGDLEFCLAPLARDNEGYRAYYKRAAAAGRFVLLDNGTAEGALVDNDTLIDLAAEIGAVEVVAPDVLFDGPGTVEATRDFIGTLMRRVDHFTTIMAVPQGATVSEYVKCADKLATLPTVRTLGLSKYSVRRCFSRFDSPSLVDSRARAIDAVTHLGKSIHLLGADGSLTQEIVRLVSHPHALVRSNDSAFAYWAACCGVELELGGKARYVDNVGSSDLHRKPDLRARRRACVNAAALLQFARGLS
jgi:hypothetical protein